MNLPERIDRLLINVEDAVQENLEKRFGNKYFDDDTRPILEAKSSLLAAFEEVLPEKGEAQGLGRDKSNWMAGFNSAIDTIRKRVRPE